METPGPGSRRRKLPRRAPLHFRRQHVEDHVDARLLALIVGLVLLLVVEPPELALLHPHLFVLALQDAALVALQHQMVAIARLVVFAAVEMAIDMAEGPQPDDGGATRLTADAGDERFQPRGYRRKPRIHLGLPAFVNVAALDARRIGLYGAAQVDGFGFPLLPHLCLPAGIHQEQIELLVQFGHERGDIHAHDQAEALHDDSAFPATVTDDRARWPPPRRRRGASSWLRRRIGARRSRYTCCL
jgi:hypothetical protein